MSEPPANVTGQMPADDDMRSPMLGHVYMSPDPWEVVETEHTIEVRPRRHIHWLPIGCMTVASIMAPLAFGWIAALMGGPGKGWWFFWFMLIACSFGWLVMLVAHLRQKWLGPWLVVDLEKRTMRLPRFHEQAALDDVREWQGLYCQFHKPRRMWVAELNVFVFPRRIRRWPIVGSTHGPSVELLGARLAELSGIPFSMNEAILDAADSKSERA